MLVRLANDPGLHILGITFVGIVGTVGAWLTASAWRVGSPAAIGFMLLLALGSAEGVRIEVRARRRPGSLTGLIAATWLAIAVGTVAALRWDVL